MKTTADKINAWQQSKKRMLPAALLLSLGFVLVLQFWAGRVLSLGFNLGLFLVLTLGIANVPARLTRWQVVPFGLVSGIFAFFLTVDPLVYNVDGVPKRWPLWSVLIFALFFVTLFLACLGLSQFLAKLDVTSIQNRPAQGRKSFFVYFGCMMACWLVVFLSFGPLRISADSYNVIQQALGNYPLNDSHPIVYTLVLRLFLSVGLQAGSLTAGAYLFGLAQMLFFGGILAYALLWLRQQGAPALFVWICLAYYALSPVFSINGFTAWKDIPFNGVLLLYVLFLYQVVQSEAALLQKTKGMAAFLALSGGLCFLRGNGFLIVLAVMTGLSLAYRKSWRRWLVFFIPFLIAIKLIQGPVYSALGITRLGGVESAAIPLQQVARAIKNGAPLTQEEQAFLEKIIPVQAIKDSYVSASPDPIKTHPQFDGQAFDENRAQFMSLWLRLVKTNKQVYLDAWLLQTLGYWKLDFHGWTALVSEFDMQTGIQQHDVWQQWLQVDSRAFFASRTAFFSLSQLAYLLLFTAAQLVATARKKLLVSLIPPLALWLGMMTAAPAYAEFRYMMLLALSLPYMIFLLLSGSGEID